MRTFIHCVVAPFLLAWFMLLAFVEAVLGIKSDTEEDDQ